MQIHEITEGLLSNVARGFASGVTGMDLPQSQASIDRQAAQAAQKLRAQGYGTTQPGTVEKITVMLTQPGNVPAKYVKTGNVWTNEVGAVITDAKQKAFLDSMIPSHGKKELVQVEPAPQIKKVSRQRAPRRNTVRR
jgi:hypothetical protein